MTVPAHAATSAAALAGVPVLSALLSPDRWLLWLGVLFVVTGAIMMAAAVGWLFAPETRPASSVRLSAVSASMRIAAACSGSVGDIGPSAASAPSLSRGSADFIPPRK